MAQLCGKIKEKEKKMFLIDLKIDLMIFIIEASTLLKRLSERLYQQHHREQQSDINSLQEILDSPLFHTLYNLQESFQQLKFEFEKGNSLIKNCSFKFDIEGHLKIINDQISMFYNKDLHMEMDEKILTFLFRY